MKNETILSCVQFFNKGTFVIPNFQRGYKWAVENANGIIPLEKLINDFVSAYNSNLKEYYIQGVTVYEDDNSISKISKERRKVVLIDGQQRTTSLYLILKYLGVNFFRRRIKYEIRAESDKVLNEFKICDGELVVDGINLDDDAYHVQDIHYFKQAVKIIHRKLSDIDKTQFACYILRHIKLYYILIDKEKSVKAFSMLNGYKAKITDEELIKAAILSKISKGQNSQKTNDWDLNNLRNKYAREWDKWLYWWNRTEVLQYFGERDKAMGLLLRSYYTLNAYNSSRTYGYSAFYEQLISNGNCKLLFKSIRDLQKRFEQLFTDPHAYNYIGIILKTTNLSEREKALHYYLHDTGEMIEYSEYAKWVLVGATHLEIFEKGDENKNTIIREQKAEKAYHSLREAYVYWDENDKNFEDDRLELAFRQLLRMNVDKEDKCNRKFDFSIWNSRTLEHIWPKSRKDEIIWPTETSVHCIGNLVLLYKTDNSSFSNSNPQDKKNSFFKNEKVRNSMKLLHTVSVFTFDDWNGNTVLQNKNDFLKNLKNTYNLNIN